MIGGHGNRHAERPRSLRSEARRRLRGLAENFADPVEARSTARLLGLAGELELAHRVYRHAEKLGVDEPASLVEHAEILARLGRRERAIALLERAAARHIVRGGARALAIIECALGEHHRDTGDLEAARAIAERWLTHPEVWDLATFLWVDCVSLEGRSLERAVKLAVERGNASPAMFHALLQELEEAPDPAVIDAILSIGDETLFVGWVDAIPELRSLVDRLLARPPAGALATR